MLADAPTLHLAPVENDLGDEDLGKALGRFATVRVRGAGETVTVTGPVTVLTGLLVSVALTVTVVDPAVVGVPVITQLAPRVSPAGSEPAVMEQL